MPLPTELRRLTEAVGAVMASTVVYYLIPVRWGGALGSWALAAAFSAGLVLVVSFILHQLRQTRRSPLGASPSIAGLLGDRHRRGQSAREPDVRSLPDRIEAYSGK